MYIGYFFAVWTVCIVQLVAIVFNEVASQKSDDQRCTEQITCGQCIGHHPSCSWCKQEVFGNKATSARCDLKVNLLNRNCTLDDIVTPSTSVEVINDDPLSEAGVKTGSYVQLKPQKMRLRLRPREVVTFPLVFRQAEDYPIDLYYLMDLTYSMRDDKEKLHELGDMLAESMSNLTNNLRIGFGSFVDKVLLPYVNTVPSKLKNPCLDGKVCAPPYGFHNHMPLSNNTRRFSQEVANAKVSANLDDAEGGFDAIMQVIVCKDDINWHDKSRKIILFATDSGFHYAGDGKLGGVVVPNDETCHLDESGYYTMSKHQDYPSLSQISRKLRDHKVLLIFAVTSYQLPVYTELSNALREGVYTRELADDSSNIVELIRKQYEEISSEVEMKVDNLPDNVRVLFKADCPGGIKGSNHCKGLKVGTTVQFNVSLEVEECPKGGSFWSREITFYPAGLDEVMKLQLDMYCECDCEMPDEEIVDSPICSNMGTYECGICTSCGEDHYGTFCECNSTDLNAKSHLDACRVDNTSLICSGNGECICGKCYCTPSTTPSEEITGTYCHCKNFMCSIDEELGMCGGPQRGTCECNECRCKAGWKGPTCTCPTSNDGCIANNGEICSGNGQCVCGRCICSNLTETWFGGTHCDDCPTCDNSQCAEFRKCVECQMWKTGDFTEEECQKNCALNATFVDHFSEENARHCQFFDENGCKYQFTYKFNAMNKPVLEVLEMKECGQQANLLFIALGVTGGIVLIGIVILLIVRLCMFIKDRRDYARFLEEVEKTNWGSEQNPIYKAAISNYTNPTYGTSKLK